MISPTTHPTIMVLNAQIARPLNPLATQVQATTEVAAV